MRCRFSLRVALLPLITVWVSVQALKVPSSWRKGWACSRSSSLLCCRAVGVGVSPEESADWLLKVGEVLLGQVIQSFTGQVGGECQVHEKAPSPRFQSCCSHRACCG